MALAGALCQTLLAATGFSSPLTAANQSQAPSELRAALAASTRHVDDNADCTRLPRPRET